MTAIRRAQILAARRRWRMKHAAHARAYVKAWRSRSKEKHRAQRSRYYARHREAVNVVRRRRYASDKIRPLSVEALRTSGLSVADFL